MSLPSANVLLRAAQLSIDEDKPLYFDYFRDSIDKKCCIAAQGSTKYLAKTNNEYTSTIQSVFKCETCYIVMTENSLYVIDSGIPIKRIIAPSEEKAQ